MFKRIYKDYGNCSNCGHNWNYHTGSDSWGFDEDIWTNTICIHRECDPSGSGERDSSKCTFFYDNNGLTIPNFE